MQKPTSSYHSTQTKLSKCRKIALKLYVRKYFDVKTFQGHTHSVQHEPGGVDELPCSSTLQFRPKTWDRSRGEEEDRPEAAETASLSPHGDVGN